MDDLSTVAPAFVEIAHGIVWATLATVDDQGRARTRIVHPVWAAVDGELVGWVGTDAWSPKATQLAANPTASVSYWSPAQATAVADGTARWHVGDEERRDAWERFATAPEPVGYDPATIAKWVDGPTSARFAVIELRPWHVRVLDPAAGRSLSWTAPS